MYTSKVREGVSERSVDNLSFLKANLEIVTALESANVVIMYALVLLRKSYAEERQVISRVFGHSPLGKTID